MGRRGPIPKPDHLRQRRNKVAPPLALPSPRDSAGNEVPPLPERDGGWLPEVLEWWESVWRSPMASRYLGPDVKGGLLLLADLHQARWTVRDDPRLLLQLASEIRQQEVRFGLSPIDRTRLRWEVGQEDAPPPAGAGEEDAPPARRAPRIAKVRQDPRELLKAVG